MKLDKIFRISEIIRQLVQRGLEQRAAQADANTDAEGG